MKPFKFSPSHADRWMTCPGSVALVASLPGKEEQTHESTEGKQAHVVADALLTGKPIDYGVTSASMIQDAAMYAHFIKASAGNARIESEYRVSMASACSELPSSGVVDAFFFSPADKRLTVVDYKYGLGVKVDATDNRQMKLYALALVEELAFLGSIEQVRLVIFQPRIKNKEGNPHVSTCELTVEELAAFKAEVLAAVQEAKSEKPVLKQSEEACRFCPAFSVCPKQHEGLAVVMDEVINDSLRPPAACLTPEALSAMALRFDGARKLMTKLEEELKAHLQAGTKLPHHKLVEHRPKRAWAEGAVLRMVAELPKELLPSLIKLEPKPVGITEAEKFLKKEKGLLEPFLAGKDPVPVVALIDDTRPEWGYNSASKFSEFSKEESN